MNYARQNSLVTLSLRHGPDANKATPKPKPIVGPAQPGGRVLRVNK